MSLSLSDPRVFPFEHRATMGRPASEILLRRWQSASLGTLLVGYAGYYLCRSNLSVAAPLILREGQGLGVTKETLGAIMSAGVLVYAAGKLVNGVVADRSDGRGIFLLGMAGSALCTVVFGMGGGLAVLTLAWALNRYVQAMGWPGLVRIAGRWFPGGQRATVMGVLSGSYLAGDAVARLLLSLFIAWGLGWRQVFFLSGALLAGLALVSGCTLRGGSRDVGLDEEGEEGPAAPPGGGGTIPGRPGVWSLLAPLLGLRTFWLVCAVNFGLTLIRETFNAWTPTFLVEAVGLTPQGAAAGSLVFPLTGAAAAAAAGWLSDRTGGRHGRVMVPSVALLVVVLGVLSATPLRDRPAGALGLLAAASAFLIAPYSFPSGVLSLDLGGRQRAATASGLVDTAGYLGAVFSGYGIARIAERQGWAAAFGVLAAVAALTGAAVVAYSRTAVPAKNRVG
jgi:OPA family glycerol-3-phosphate transporter-like MFS transporter